MECDNVRRRLEPFPVLRLDQHPTKGRLLRAAQAVPADTLLFRGAPYAVVIIESFKKRVCESCLFHYEPPRKTNDVSNTEDGGQDIQHDEEAEDKESDDEQPKQHIIPKHFTEHCEACKQVYYCSIQCKNADKEAHAIICPIYKRLLTWKKLGRDILSIVKIVVKIMCRRHNEKQGKDDFSFRHRCGVDWLPEWETSGEDIDRLVSNLHIWSKDDRDEWKKPIQVLMQVLPPEMLEKQSQEDILLLISRIESNNFGLWMGQREVCFGRGKGSSSNEIDSDYSCISTG